MLAKTINLLFSSHSFLNSFVNDYINDLIKNEILPDLVQDVVRKVNKEMQYEQIQKKVPIMSDNVSDRARKLVVSVDSKLRKNDSEKYF